MLTKITLDNFLSFKHIEIDFMGPKKIPKNLILIYGANGSGKTNLMNSIMFLKHSINTLNNIKYNNEAYARYEKLKSMTLEEIMNENSLFPSVHGNSGFNLTNIADLTKKTIMINTKEIMTLRYDFKLDNINGYYILEFKNNKLLHEMLYYKIRSRSGKLFKIQKTSEKINIDISKEIFNSNISKDILELIEKYWGKHTLLSILNYVDVIFNEKYAYDNIGDNLWQVLEFFRMISIECKGKYDTVKEGFRFISNKLFNELDHGIIDENEIDKIKLVENILSKYFIRLYNDIDSVYYKFDKKKDKYTYHLFIKKIINDDIIDVSIDEESTGTRKILDLFPLFYECMNGNTVIIDEMDTGIHDILITHIINELKDDITGQLIATTHNTLLMECVDASNVYILQNNISEKSINTLKSLNYTPQKNHNHRLRYLSGLYGGIPEPVSLDFLGLINDVAYLPEVNDV